MKSILGNFYRHLAIFFWSYWSVCMTIQLYLFITLGGSTWSGESINFLFVLAMFFVRWLFQHFPNLFTNLWKSCFDKMIEWMHRLNDFLNVGHSWTFFLYFCLSIQLTINKNCRFLVLKVTTLLTVSQSLPTISTVNWFFNTCLYRPFLFSLVAKAKWQKRTVDLRRIWTQAVVVDLWGPPRRAWFTECIKVNLTENDHREN